MNSQIPKSPSTHSGFVYINDMDVAQKVSTDDRFGPPQMENHLRAVQDQSGTDLSNLILVSSNALFFMSGDHHMALRQRIMKSLGPSRMGLWRTMIDEVVDRSLRGLDQSNTADLISTFTYPIFTQATQKILGISPSRPEEFEYWVSRLQELLVPLLPLRTLRKMEGAFSDLLSQLKNQKTIEEVNGQKPLLLEFLEEPVEGFSKEDMLGAVLVLYGASLNVSQTMANIIFHILSGPQSIRDSARDEQWVKENLEYLIKVSASPRYIHRIAQEDNKVSNSYEFTTKDNVLIDLPGIHSEGCPFSNKPKWDQEGLTQKSHLAFGKGIHYCVGAGYARYVIERSIPALFRQYPNLKLISSEPDISDNPQAVSLNTINCQL